MRTSETNHGSTLGEQRDRDDKVPDYLERDIDATRADVRATLSALERRLSLDHLVEMTVGRIRERGGEFAGNLTDAATQNPVPVLLTSIGLGWMMLASRGNGGGSRAAASARARAGEASDGISAAAERASEHVQEAFASSRDGLNHATESLRAGASRAASTTREQLEHARERADRLLHEQPLMLGALGLAAGAIMGALLPATEAEDRLIGDVRETAVKKFVRSTRNGHAAASDSGETADQTQSRPH
jgi:hypothetical protein